MGFVIGFLTLVMVLDCLVLVLLVLVQLPKKEAGAGLAFGGGASDALFGAGSGNVLTKITKYAAGFFFFLAVVLGILQSHYHSSATSSFERSLQQTAPARPGPTAPRSSGPAAAVPPVTGTNATAPNVEATNVPVIPLPPPTSVVPTNMTAPGTNAAPK